MPTITINGKNYVQRRPNPAQILNLERNSGQVSDRAKDIYYHNQDNEKISKYFLKQFPNFNDILKNAPEKFSDRVVYADSVAKANPKMYLTDEQLKNIIPNFTEYKRRRSEFPSYIGGNFKTLGSGKKADNYGIRAALLRPKARLEKIDNNSVSKFSYVADESGEPKMKLESFYIDPLNDTLSRLFAEYKKGGTLIHNKWKQ